MSRRDLEKALNVVEAQLRGRPTLELKFERARLLDRLGRAEAARKGYVEVLQRDPAHFGALNDLGTLLYKAGLVKEATTCYSAAAAKHPENPIGHANLAFMLLRGGDAAGAREHYETALRLDPKNVEAHRGLALAMTELGDTEGARAHREAGFREAPLTAVPFRGEGEPVRALVLVSASPGNTRTDAFLDDRVFAVTKLVVEFYDPSIVLPAHDFVWNAVGDADICGAALHAARAIVAQSQAPLINAPAAVEPTGRSENAARLRALEGVVAPRAATLERAALEGAGAVELLASHGLHFPLLLRSPGFHTGKNFVRVERAEDLAAAVAPLPGERLIALEFLDVRGADGKVRKYRAMIVDGELYPLHLAIAHDWKVHYFSADMAENAAHRLEEQRFLADMPGALGAPAIAALGRVAQTLGLAYAGIDFALDPAGRVVVFEANATMVLPVLDDDPRFAYRHPPVERIAGAVRAMLLKTAGRGETV